MNDNHPVRNGSKAVTSIELAMVMDLPPLTALLNSYA